MVNSSDVVLIIIALIFPPLAVLLLAGCGADFLINLVLTLFLGYFPGHIHAFWLIYLMLKARDQYGRRGYIYVGSGNYVARPHIHVPNS